MLFMGYIDFLFYVPVGLCVLTVTIQKKRVTIQLHPIFVRFGVYTYLPSSRTGSTDSEVKTNEPGAHPESSLS